MYMMVGHLLFLMSVGIQRKEGGTDREVKGKNNVSGLKYRKNMERTS